MRCPFQGDCCVDSGGVAKTARQLIRHHISGTSQSPKQSFTSASDRSAPTHPTSLSHSVPFTPLSFFFHITLCPLLVLSPLLSLFLYFCPLCLLSLILSSSPFILLSLIALLSFPVHFLYICPLSHSFPLSSLFLPFSKSLSSLSVFLFLLFHSPFIPPFIFLSPSLLFFLSFYLSSSHTPVLYSSSLIPILPSSLHSLLSLFLSSNHFSLLFLIHPLPLHPFLLLFLSFHLSLSLFSYTLPLFSLSFPLPSSLFSTYSFLFFYPSFSLFFTHTPPLCPCPLPLSLPCLSVTYPPGLFSQHALCFCSRRAVSPLSSTTVP